MLGRKWVYWAAGSLHVATRFKLLDVPALLRESGTYGHTFTCRSNHRLSESVGPRRVSSRLLQHLRCTPPAPAAASHTPRYGGLGTGNPQLRGLRFGAAGTRSLGSMEPAMPESAGMPTEPRSTWRILGRRLTSCGYLYNYTKLFKPARNRSIAASTSRSPAQALPEIHEGGSVTLAGVTLAISQGITWTRLKHRSETSKGKTVEHRVELLGVPCQPFRARAVSE